MGLMNQAITIQNSSKPAEESKKKNSLLGRIAHLSSYEQVSDSFLSFLTTACSEKGFILFPVEDRLTVVFQHGVDMTSCVRMVPEQTSFAEICQKNDWSFFSDSELDVFTSYFSTRERASLVMIAIHPLSLEEETGYLVLVQSRLSLERNQIDTESVLMLIKDFELMLNKNISLLSALSVRNNLMMNSLADKAKMYSAFEERRSASLFSISFELIFPDYEKIETDFDSFTLYRAMVTMIIKQAGPASIVHKKKNYSLRMILFTASETDYDLYIHQMKKPLEKLFGHSRIKKVEIKYKGTARTSDYALDFLAGER